MKIVNTWESRGFAFDGLVSYLGNRVSLMGRRYGQLRLKNNVEITVHQRITGIDLYLCLAEIDGSDKYYNYTKSYQINELDNLFSEMETKISDLFSQQETKRQKLQKIWGQR